MWCQNIPRKILKAVCSKLCNSNYSCSCSLQQRKTRDLDVSSRLYIIANGWNPLFHTKSHNRTWKYANKCLEFLLSMKRSVMKESKLPYGILYIVQLLLATASASMIWKDDYCVFGPHIRRSHGRPIDPGTFILVHLYIHVECHIYLKTLVQDLHSNHFYIAVIRYTTKTI